MTELTGGLRVIVAVEGETDKLALDEAAKRLGRDLDAEGVCVVPIGGAHAIGKFLRSRTDETAGVKLAGLCDAGEEGIFRRALEADGHGPGLDRQQMERLGFFVCDADLEDELIRAAGVASMVSLIKAGGDLQPWLTFQKEPAQRGRSVEQQLRRFIRSISGRNPKYVRAIIRSLEPGDLPAPLRGLLAYVAGSSARSDQRLTST